MHHGVTFRDCSARTIIYTARSWRCPLGQEIGAQTEKGLLPTTYTQPTSGVSNVSWFAFLLMVGIQGLVLACPPRTISRNVRIIMTIFYCIELQAYITLETIRPIF